MRRLPLPYFALRIPVAKLLFQQHKTRSPGEGKENGGHVSWYHDARRWNSLLKVGARIRFLRLHSQPVYRIALLDSLSLPSLELPFGLEQYFLLIVQDFDVALDAFRSRECTESLIILSREVHRVVPHQKEEDVPFLIRHP